MKLIGYVENKVDRRVELDTDDLAKKYLESKIEENRAGWPLERKLLMFLMIDTHVDPDGAVMTGVNIAWDRDEADNEMAYDALYQAVIDARKAAV